MVFAALIASAGPVSARAQAPTPEAEVARGVAQVRDGDFEGAIVTLDAAIAALRAEAGRSRPLLVQAYIQNGVAHVALDHEDLARRAFREALDVDRDLRLTTERFSPKVVRTFDAAREAFLREQAAARPKKGGKTALIVGGAVAAVAGGVVLATRGDEAPPATPTFRDARFGTTVLVCPDGVNAHPLSFFILVEAQNPTSEPVRITDVTSTITIRASPAFPSEVGFANTEPTQAMPAIIPPASNATVQLTSRIVCGNGPGDQPRVNEWSGRVTLTTSAGVFALETADRMVINLP